MNGNPTAAQKRWHEFLIDYGCCIDEHKSNVSIHHIKGSKMNLKGVKKPGEWYCIPLSFWWHQDGSNPYARHINKKYFEKNCGFNEKELFIEMVGIYERRTGSKPMLEQEYQIIVDRA